MPDILANDQRRREASLAADSAASTPSTPAAADRAKRLELLLDEGSFEEFDMFVRHRSTDFGMEADRPHGDGVTGWGNGQRPHGLCVFAGFHRVRRQRCRKPTRKNLQDHGYGDAERRAAIGLNDSGGAHSGRRGLAWPVMPRCSSAISWPRAWCRRFQRGSWGPVGGAVYSPGDDRFHLHGEGHGMFVTGPDGRKTVTNEVVTAEDTGRRSTHTKKSSVADGAFENDVEAMTEIAPG